MAESKPENPHFNRQPRRRVDLINPVNGRMPMNLDMLAELSASEYQRIASLYLDAMERAIGPSGLPRRGDPEALIAEILYPAMQLKATGARFQYPLVSRMAGRLIEFLEVVAVLDEDALIVVLVIHTTMRTVLMALIKGDGGSHGDDLLHLVEEACRHYFDRHP